VEVASQGVQVHGGMGFIEETGAAQHYRDARIAPIYEGTNGIQAIDLVGRKLTLADGEAVRSLIGDISETALALATSRDVRLQSIGKRLADATRAVRETTAWLSERHATADSLAGASAYLRLLGDTTGGWMLAKGALAGSKRGGADSWWGTRIGLARLYAETVLARAPGLAAAVQIGDGDLAAATPVALGLTV
jgi:hypothetical protein